MELLFAAGRQLEQWFFLFSSIAVLFTVKLNHLQLSNANNPWMLNSSTLFTSIKSPLSVHYVWEVVHTVLRGLQRLLPAGRVRCVVRQVQEQRPCRVVRCDDVHSSLRVQVCRVAALPAPVHRAVPPHVVPFIVHKLYRLTLYSTH